MVSAGAVASAGHAGRSATEATTMRSPMRWRGLHMATVLLIRRSTKREVQLSSVDGIYKEISAISLVMTYSVWELSLLRSDPAPRDRARR